MAYEELEQFLDTKQARIFEMFTIWNLLGFVTGFGIGQVLTKVSGVGALTPLCILVGVVLTLRQRNMLVLLRVWLHTFFWVRRWSHRDIVTATVRRTAPTQQVQQQVAVLERVVNGQVVFGRRRRP